MTDKAIITRRGTPRSDAVAAFETAEAANLGFMVEHTLPQGTLVRGDQERYAALEAQGYRVKLLTDTNILEVGPYRIDTEAAPPRVPSRLEVPKTERPAWPHHLVQLSAPPIEEWVRTIEEQGVDVVEPVSAYGLFVVGAPEQVRRLEQLPFVEWTGAFKPAYRISPTLLGMRGKIRYVNVGVYPAAETERVRAFIQARRGV